MVAPGACVCTGWPVSLNPEPEPRSQSRGSLACPWLQRVSPSYCRAERVYGRPLEVYRPVPAAPAAKTPSHAPVHDSFSPVNSWEGDVQTSGDAERPKGAAAGPLAMEPTTTGAAGGLPAAALGGGAAQPDLPEVSVLPFRYLTDSFLHRRLMNAGEMLALVSFGITRSDRLTRVGCPCSRLPGRPLGARLSHERRGLE